MSQQQAKQYKAIGEDLWKNRTEKVVSRRARKSRTFQSFKSLIDIARHFQNAELFSFTYGALVVQLIKDYQDYAEVNKQLEKMSVILLSASYPPSDPRHCLYSGDTTSARASSKTFSHAPHSRAAPTFAKPPK